MAVGSELNPTSSAPFPPSYPGRSSIRSEDCSQLDEGHAAVVDDVQFVRTQAEHAAAQTVEDLGQKHEETEPDHEQQKAKYPAT
jgi:hypothetical protein